LVSGQGMVPWAEGASPERPHVQRRSRPRAHRAVGRGPPGSRPGRLDRQGRPLEEPRS